MRPDRAINRLCDVAIVGAGPSGAIAARRFAEAGMSVVCLEQGEYFDYTVLKPDEPIFELTRDQFVTWNPNTRKSRSDYPINDSESDIAALMWNGVGGSSIVYGASYHRLRPSDFRVRTLDGVAEDWPISYDDLAPYYARTEVDLAVSGVGGDTAYPHFDPPLPPFPVGNLEKRFYDAHDRLGWHIWAGSNMISTVRHAGLQPCVRRGACMWGCFDGSKGSVDRTHWPINRKLGVKLIERARVASIETDDQGLATGVIYIHQSTGTTHFQPAGIVVLCANAIGTPRILLNSANGKFANGLANRSDQVGRNLMLHPCSAVIGLFDEFFEDCWQGPSGQRAYCLQFGDTVEGAGFYRGAKWQLAGSGGPLAALGAWPWGPSSSWGKNFHTAIQKRFGRTVTWHIVGEDLPSPDNRVMIDPTLKDADGIPAPKISYRCSENSRKLMTFHEEHAAISMREAGAYETLVPAFVRESGWHILGSARMGDDPETSVVDGFGRAHDVPNLFIFDGSVMPTSGPVNPCGTVAALALRNAEAVVNSRGDQRVSAHCA